MFYLLKDNVKRKSRCYFLFICLGRYIQVPKLKRKIPEFLKLNIFLFNSFYLVDYNI